MAMGKILASDYDGTLSPDGTVVDGRTMRLIREWRAAGNLFGLVTGRDRLMTRDALMPQGLEADFLVCNNGTVLLDGDYEVLWSGGIPLAVVRELIDSPELRESRYVVLADPVGRYVYDDRFDEAAYCDIYYTGVLDRDSIAEHPLFYQMDTWYPDARAMRRIGDRLEERFGGVVTVNRNVNTIDLAPPGTDKATGLDRYLSLRGLEGWDVVTVGDGLNDLPMIARHGGYAMAWSIPEIRRQAPRGVVGSVAEVIEAEL